MAGHELATAYVSLSVSGQGLRRDVDKALGVAVADTGKKQGGRLGGLVSSGFKKAAVGGFAGAGAVAGAALYKGFGRLKSLDEAKGKLEGLGHSTKTVDKIMDNALKSVKGTAFGMDEAATTAAGAVAAGVKPGKALEKNLKLVADAATIAGTDMGSMGSIFNKVASSNKIQGDVIAQLGDQGIPILQFLADEMGVTAEEASKMASKGEVDFKTFQAAMEDGLGGAAASSGKTFSGAMKNSGAALGRLGASLLSGIFPKMKDGFGGITDLLDRMGPAAESMGKKLGGAISAVAGYVGDFIKDFKAGDGAAGRFRDVLESVFGFVKGTAIPAAIDLAEWVNDNREKFLAIAAGVLTAVAAFKAFMFAKKVIAVIKAARAAALGLNAVLAANPIFLVVAAIGVLVAALVYLYRNNDKARAIMQRAWAAIKKAISVTVDWLKTTAWPIVKSIFKGIATVATWLWKNVIKPVFKGIGVVIKWWYQNIVKRYFAAVVTIFRGAAKVAKWLWQNGIKPAFHGIAAVAKWLWGRIKGNFNLMSTIFRGAKKVVGWLWGHIKSYFRRIASNASWLWDKVKVAFDKMKSGVRAVRDAFSSARKSIGKIWEKLTSTISKPINGALGWIERNFLSKVRSVLRAIGAKGLADKIPVLRASSSKGAPKVGTRPGLQKATGGWVPGHSPTPTADNIPAWLTAGEYVLPVKATARLAAQVGHAGLEQLRRGNLPGYAMGGRVGGLNPKFLQALNRFNKAAGGRFSVLSGLRTRAEQQVLYNRYLAGTGNLAARPGTSRHETGNAADLTPSNARDTHGALARKFGLHFPVPGEAWHIELINGAKGGGGIFSGLAGKILDKGASALSGLLDKAPGGFWVQAGVAAMKKTISAIVSRVQDAGAAGDGSAPSGGFRGGNVERWRSTVLRALGIMGLSSKYANSTLRRMMQESGGNPRAINNWDSNARKGTPSKGLMQVIDPTFRAYAHPKYSRDIYDPLSNILASMRYAQSRYGSLWAAYDRKGGYSSGGLVKPAVFDNGGTLAPGYNLVHNKLGRPEPLVRPDQFMSGPVVVNVIDRDGTFVDRMRGEIEAADKHARVLSRMGV